MKEKIKSFEKYLVREEKARNTIKKYLRDINEFYEWLSQSENYSNCPISKEVFLNYKEYLKQIKKTVTTINSKISSINAFLSFTQNDNMKLKCIKCQKGLFNIKEKELNKRDFHKLYDNCCKDEKLSLLLDVIARTGIRVSEIKYITYEALEAEKAVVYNKGKIRIVLIQKATCKKLLEYCKKCKINFGPVFLTRNGRPMDRRQIWLKLKKLAVKSGIDKKKVFPHNLRHLFAREFYKNTKDIVKLSSILGHSSIETTRIYTKENIDEYKKMIESITF